MKGGYCYNKKWRKLHPKKWKSQKDRYYQKHCYHGRSRKYWTEEEINLVLSKSSIGDALLARTLGRSVRAVQIKRSRVKNANKKTYLRRPNK